VTLHGVGNYTTRFILIHVDEVGVAGVDVNIRRLLSCFSGTDSDGDRIAPLADALAPTGRNSDFQHATLDCPTESMSLGYRSASRASSRNIV
jgi:adenine-specific DNA glycosylase